MQIRLTDINTDRVMQALVDNGFGTVRTWDDRRGGLKHVDIWTDDGEQGPHGYEVGMLRLEMASFTRHEMVLETNRIPQDRLMALLTRIAAENR